MSRRSGGGGTVGELAPSLLTAPWRKQLLMLAGDIESNPGPYTRYGKNETIPYTNNSYPDFYCKDLCMVLTHIPTSSYLLTSKRNYHEITSCGMNGTFSSISTNLMTKINVPES